MPLPPRRGKLPAVALLAGIRDGFLREADADAMRTEAATHDWD